MTPKGFTVPDGNNLTILITFGLKNDRIDETWNLLSFPDTPTRDKILRNVTLTVFFVSLPAVTRLATRFLTRRSLITPTKNTAAERRIRNVLFAAPEKLKEDVFLTNVFFVIVPTHVSVPFKPLVINHEAVADDVTVPKNIRKVFFVANPEGVKELVNDRKNVRTPLRTLVNDTVALSL